MENEEFINQKTAYQQPEQERRKKIRKDDILNSYYNIVRNISQLLGITRLYEFEHKVFKEKLNQVFEEVSKLLSEKQPLSFFESGGILLVNGKDIETKDTLTRRFVESLRNLDVGYLTLEPGLTLEELIVFIHLLKEESLKGEKKIEEYLKEKAATHIIPHFATYKIVEEGERVVKKDEILTIEELSSEMRDKFLQDLKSGEVGKQLLKGEQKYRVIAHNPIFLSEVVSDLVKEKNNSEELARVLWLIGDYLIGEVDTPTKEKINLRAIEELKKQILSLWKKKISKADIKKHIQKTFAAISLALEIQGLILLYKKHKKNMDKTVLKIQEIFKLLPPESQLYQKTKEKLEKIGFLSPQNKNTEQKEIV